MAHNWQDMADLVPVNGWSCFRTRSIGPDGVSDIVVLHLLHQETHEQMAFVMSLDVATRCGFDMVGAGTRIYEYEETE